MASDEIKGLAVKIALEDGTFQQGVTSLKQNLSVINSEFKASVAGVKDWGNSLDSLKNNATALGEKITVQKQIVQAYAEQLQKSKDALSVNSEKMLELKGKLDSTRSAYEASKTAVGENDEATKKLKNELDALNGQYTTSENLVRRNNTSVNGYTVQVNNAQGALNGMEGELRQTNTQLDEATRRQSLFGQASDKLHLSMQNLKIAFGAVGIAAAGYLKGAVDSATKAQEETDALSNLLQNQGITVKDASTKIDIFTSSITKMSSFSKGEAREAMQVLAEKGVSVGNSIKMAGTISDVAAGQHKTLAEAADLVANAYNGKTKALTALGILTKDEAKQLGNTETATIKMSDVQDRLNKRFGGASAAELETYSGKMKENQNTLNATSTQIGTALLPVLAKLAEFAAKVLIPIATWIQENPKLTAVIVVVVAAVGILIGGLTALTTVTAAFGITLDLAVLPTIGLVVLAIVALIAVVILVVKNWGAISGFFVGLWDGVKKIFWDAWNFIKDIFLKYTPAGMIISHWGAIAGFFVGLWNGIKSGFSSVVNFLIDGINSLIKLLLTPFNFIIKGINLISPIKIPELKLAIPNIPKFDVGSNYVPYDMLAIVHEGERITPKSQNPYANSGGGTTPQGGGDIYITNYTILDGKVVQKTVSQHQFTADKVRTQALGAIA